MLHSPAGKGSCCLQAFVGPDDSSAAWPGPSLARTRLKTSGNLEIQILKLGIKQLPKDKIIEIQIHVAQSVGKVWTGQKNSFLAPFGAILGNCSMDREKKRGSTKITYFPWWANGPYSPVFTCSKVSVWCHFVDCM